jgi:hypothetical protein
MKQVNVCNKNDCLYYNDIKEKVVYMCDDDNIIFYVCKKLLTYDDIEENVIYMCDQEKLFYFFKYEDEIKIGINFNVYENISDISFYKAIKNLTKNPKTFNTDIIPKNIDDAKKAHRVSKQNKCGTFNNHTKHNSGTINKLTFFQKSVNHLKNNSLIISIIISACLIYYFNIDTFLNH